jgi:protein TonB
MLWHFLWKTAGNNIHLKPAVMKTIKRRLQLLMAAITLCLFIACNNKTETSSSSNDSNTNIATTPQGNDSTVTTPPAETGTSQATNKTAAKHKRTGKATAGFIAQNKSGKTEAGSTGVYEFSEVRPAYPGGQEALENYITSNIVYPDAAIENNIQGTVEVQFTVDENGKITDAHSLGNRLGDGLDEEAVRVITTMPKWMAGTVKHKAVKSKVTIPITFKIEAQ